VFFHKRACGRAGFPIDTPAADPGLLRVRCSLLAPVLLPEFNLTLRMSDPREH
jgi:hypothetical protein